MKIKKIWLLVWLLPGIFFWVSNGYCRLAFEKELAQKFCPSLQLHSGDQGVCPKSVDIMSNGRVDGITTHLDENDLWCRLYDFAEAPVGEFDINDSKWKVINFANWPPGSLYDNSIYNQEPLTVVGWPPGLAGGAYYAFFHYDFGGPGRDSPSTWYEDYHKLSGMYRNTIYAHVFPSGNKAVVQYWLFYPFNDWVNNHEGDWEHINVGLSSQNPATAKIEYVDYYFHHSVIRCKKPGVDFFVDDKTHPVVFVGGHGDWKDGGMVGSGEGSHGCYPVKGNWYDVQYLEKFEDPDEYIDGSGKFLSYKGFDLKIIPNKDEIVYGKDTDLYWMRSNVLWGHRDVDSPGDWGEGVPVFGPDEVGNTPPRTPTFHPGWNDEGSSSKQKWYTGKAPYSPVTASGYTIPKVGLLGDVNGDGKVSILDITKLERYLIGLDSDCNMTNADANKDGKVSVADITAIERIILGLPLPAPAKITTPEVISQLEMQGIATNELKLFVSEVKGLDTLQCNLRYNPARVRIEKVEAGNLTEGARILSNIENEQGITRVLLNMSEISNEATGSGDLLKITLAEAASFEDIEITEISLGSNQQGILPFELLNPKAISPQTALFQNYPNPINPETWIPFSLSQSAEVVINIYSLSGQLIRTFELGERASGRYETKEGAAYWDGKDNQGHEVASGVYFYQLITDDFTSTRKMIVLK